MKRILVNASNLHGGGGVQVAASFIYELSKLTNNIDLKTVSVVCSTSVNSSLVESIDTNVFESFEILDLKGVAKPTSSQKVLFSGFHTCFTVFGPFYYRIKVDKHICGFAQPWIAYPETHVYGMLSLKERLLTKLKFQIQKNYFRKYDELIVEAEHVRTELKKLGFSNVEVVSNTISSIFNEIVPTKTLSQYNRNNVPLLGFIGRPYLHKNVRILINVRKLLIEKYNFECDFLFTLNKNEMVECGFDELEGFNTIGEITLNQCPGFYQCLDGLVFPSLLECFSASPIEAMKMKVPVFASKRRFVEDFCENAAYYFDPYNADNIANVIYKGFRNLELMKRKVELGSEIVAKIPNAQSRAENYVRLILR